MTYPTAIYRDTTISRFTRDRLGTASLLLNHVIAIADAKDEEDMRAAVSALRFARPNEFLSDALYAVEDVCTQWDVASDTEIQL